MNIFFFIACLLPAYCHPFAFMEQSNPFLKFTLFALAFGFRPFKIPLFPFLSEVPGGQLSIKTLEQFYIYIYIVSSLNYVLVSSNFHAFLLISCHSGVIHCFRVSFHSRWQSSIVKGCRSELSDSHLWEDRLYTYSAPNNRGICDLTVQKLTRPVGACATP